MPTKDEMITDYLKLNSDLARLEAATVQTKKKRNDLVQSIREIYGKGPHVIEGVDKVIANTKIGTWFFTDRDKWRKAGPRKPKAKKAIVNGQLVEVSSEVVSGTVTVVEEPRVIDVAAVITTETAVLEVADTVPAEADTDEHVPECLDDAPIATPVSGLQDLAKSIEQPAAPVAAPKELDPLEAALAELMDGSP